MGPSWGLRKPWEPLEALGLQSDSGALLSLLPLISPHSLLLPLTPLASLGLPGPLGPSWVSGSLGSLQKPLAALGLQSDSGALLPLLPSLPLTPSCLLSPPETPWVSLGPWDLPGASGSLGSLWKPLAALGLQLDSGALLPLLPSPPCSPLHSEPP